MKEINKFFYKITFLIFFVFSAQAESKVLSIGNLVEGVNVNDIIHYDKHAGHGIEWEDKLYQVIQHQDIVIVE